MYNAILNRNHACQRWFKKYLLQEHSAVTNLEENDSKRKNKGNNCEITEKCDDSSGI